MKVQDFHKGLYYTVREGFNADLPDHKGYIDKKWDLLIRETISHFEKTPKQHLPPMCAVEIRELARATNRRYRYLNGKR